MRTHIPERSSVWPVRIVGDIHWILSTRRRWDWAWGDPWHAALAMYGDYLRADYLYRLVRQCRPEIAVETGVHFGKTSTAILAALHRNRHGRLISIDLPRTAATVNADGRLAHAHVRSLDETGHLVPHDLRDRWDLRLGDARVLLPPALEGGLGFFFHDSDHSHAHQEFEFETAWRALSVGGVLASDDTDWSTAWPEFLARHRGELEPLPNGPAGIRAVRRTA
ncbi:MAG: class I SAM-dependent methyltransferase [Thermoplasmata archaeon]